MRTTKNTSNIGHVAEEPLTGSAGELVDIFRRLSQCGATLADVELVGQR